MAGGANDISSLLYQAKKRKRPLGLRLDHARTALFTQDQLVPGKLSKEDFFVDRVRTSIPVRRDGQRTGAVVESRGDVVHRPKRQRGEDRTVKLAQTQSAQSQGKTSTPIPYDIDLILSHPNLAGIPRSRFPLVVTCISVISSSPSSPSSPSSSSPATPSLPDRQRAHADDGRPTKTSRRDTDSTTESIDGDKLNRGVTSQDEDIWTSSTSEEVDEAVEQLEEKAEDWVEETDVAIWRKGV